MKISKSRLLQIINEEVELHESNLLEFDERSLETDQEISTQEPADTNKNGKIDDKEAAAVFRDEEQKDRRSGKIKIKLKPSTLNTKEDLLLDPQTKKPLKNNKNDI